VQRPLCRDTLWNDTPWLQQRTGPVVLLASSRRAI